MKRLMAMLLAGIMVLSLTACGDSIENQTPELQEITAFLGGMEPYKSQLGKNDDIQIFFVLEEGQEDLAQQYVDVLVGGDYNISLTDTDKKNADGKSSKYNYLTYNGKGEVGTLMEGLDCHIAVVTQTDHSTGTMILGVNIANGFTYVDDGHRAEGITTAQKNESGSVSNAQPEKELEKEPEKEVQSAQKIDVSKFGNLPEHGFQDLRTWGQGAVSISDKPIDQDGFTAYKYKIDQKVLEEYIAFMENHGYTLVGSHSQSSYTGSYKSYGLVCDAASDVGKIKLMFEDSTCHVSIWKDSSKWRVDVADGIEVCDLGLRRDGSTGSVLPGGESVEAGLKRKIGGTYQTSDKRFSAKAGEADVLFNGERMAGTVDFSGTSVITVNVHFNDDMAVRFKYDKAKAKEGDVYQLCSLEPRPFELLLYKGEKNIGVGQTGDCHYHNATARIMELDDEENAVVYLYLEPINTEQYGETVELLCAVNTHREESGSGGGGEVAGGGRDKFVPDHAKPNCLDCDGTGACDECGGALYVGYGDARAKCGSCKGRGTCFTCDGSGKR